MIGSGRDGSFETDLKAPEKLQNEVGQLDCDPGQLTVYCR
jgi:hypothetical protein